MMNINRLINFLHPRAPKGFIPSIQKKIDSAQFRINLGSYARVEPEKGVSLLDKGHDYCTPLSDEDYILDVDIKQNYTINFTDRNLYQLDDCRVIGPHGDLISKTNKLLVEFSPQNGTNKNHSVFSRRKFAKPKKLSGSTFNLVTPFSDNYYHWLLESLPNLRTFGEKIHEIEQFIIPNSKAYYTETLSALGIPTSKLIELNNNHFECEQLYVATYQQAPCPPPEGPKWLQQQLINTSEEVKHSDDRRIYISRGDASWRSVKNEIETMEYLSKYGFESIELSKLDFLEQVKLFNQASVIISVHGAGLANLAFSRKGTRVLEIHPPRWTSLCYAHLSKITNCVYYYCNADQLGLSQEELLINKTHIPSGTSSQGGDITIPLDKLKLFVEQHLNPVASQTQ